MRDLLEHNTEGEEDGEAEVARQRLHVVCEQVIRLRHRGEDEEGERNALSAEELDDRAAADEDHEPDKEGLFEVVDDLPEEIPKW